MVVTVPVINHPYYYNYYQYIYIYTLCVCVCVRLVPISLLADYADTEHSQLLKQLILIIRPIICEISLVKRRANNGKGSRFSRSCPSLRDKEVLPVHGAQRMNG